MFPGLLAGGAKESFEIATRFAYQNGARNRDSEWWEHGLLNRRSGSRASGGLRC
jgi:hypothetical protein